MPSHSCRTPCGFCFVEYYTHAEALACMKHISGTKLDERIIRCDLDLGYKEGRQFGRGKSGGQVRDEHRQDYDPGRGGWGAQAQLERRREVEERYIDVQDGPGAVAGGGGEWKEPETRPTLKRARSPDDEGDNARIVRATLSSLHALTCLFSPTVYESRTLRPRECETVSYALFYTMHRSVWTFKSHIDHKILTPKGNPWRTESSNYTGPHLKFRTKCVRFEECPVNAPSNII